MVKRRALNQELLGGVCVVYWDDKCSGRAEHLHEPLTRARGGDILDPANCVATCWYCHRQIHDNPAEALERGWLKHSWDSI